MLIGGVGFLVYLILSIFVGKYATTLNRTFLPWGIASMVISPILVAILLYFLGQRESDHSTYGR